jgi:hypothetical protein
LKIGLEQFPKAPIKRWTPEDNAVLEEALKTGYLPDGRIATQVRLALYLGFSRMTIVNKLQYRQFPLHTELKSQGGQRGGLSTAHRKRLARQATIRLNSR